MGLNLSRLTGSGSSSSRSTRNPFAAYSPPSSSFSEDFEVDVAPAAYLPARSNKPQTSKERSFPERVDVNTMPGQTANFFGNMVGEEPQNFDTGPAEIAAFAGYLPGRVMETPLAALNVATGGGPDGQMPEGMLGPIMQPKAKGLIDNIADSIGQVPILGDILGGANHLLEEAGKVGPAAVNMSDIERLRALQPFSDETPLVQAQPDLFARNATNPLGFLGATMDLGKTVGDFRKEMLGRGFTDEDMAAIESGQKQPFDYGERSASTNPLLNMGYSAALDPTNLAFGLGIVGKTAKVAGWALKPVTTGIGLLPKMEKAGVAARVAPDAVTSAAMIAEGNAAGATLAGVGHFIRNSLLHPQRLVKPYAAASIGMSASAVALDMTTDWLDDRVPDDSNLSPIIKDLHDLASAIINDHPLSEGAAYNFAAAFHFPVRDLARDASTSVRGAVRATRGGEGAVAALGDALGIGGSHGQRKADFLNRYGGEQGAATLINYIDHHITREGFQGLPGIGAPIKNLGRAIDEPALREDRFHDLVEIVKDQHRENGRITNQMRVQWYKDKFGEQSGLSVSSQGGKDTGVRQPFDPVRAAEHWTLTWLPVMRKMGTVMGARAKAVAQIETVLHAEDISNIKAAWRAARGSDGTVPVEIIRRTADRYPQLVQTDEWFAQFLVADAKAPRWDKVRQRLTNTGRDAPTFGETVHELRAVEATAPPPPKMPKGPLTDEGIAPIAGHREITPEFARDVTGQGSPLDESPPSQARVPSVDDMAPVRAAYDAGQGATPEQVAQNIETDRAVFDGLEQLGLFDIAGRDPKPNVRLEYAGLNDWIKENFPGYRLGFPPEVATIMRNAEIEAPQINAQILRMNGLAETLRYWGPFSKAWNAMHFLTDPQPQAKMRENAHQAVMNYALPRGATPAQIRSIIGELGADAGKVRVGFKEMEFPIFRGWESLFPKHIEDVAQKHLDPAVYSKIKTDFGGFTRMVDRSFNRWVQRQHKAAGEGGRLARALEGTYGAYQSTVGRPLRYVQSFYPVFRFIMSPRYWAMNAMEADILSLVKYGTGAGDKKASLSYMVHRNNAMPNEKLIAEASKVVSIEGSGGPLVVGRQMAGYISRAFDSTRPESVRAVIDGLPENGPEFRYLVERFGPEQGTWAEQLDAMLYRFDTEGVGPTLKAEAERVFMQEDFVRMGPLLQRLYEVNDKNFKSVVGVLEGNNSRTNTERVLNSYFLYWPLSYQLKAGKWLIDLMTDRAFGRKTNFAGAYTYAHLMETHKEMLASDPEYGQMFEDNTDIWFAAQMIFPITPFDMGVSLNRGVRYAGGQLGWWGAYQAAQDPLSAAGKMATLGLVYDIELLQQVLADFNDNGPSKPRTQPAALYPAQAPAPTVVPLGGGGS